MKQSDTIGKLAEALAKAQGAIKGAVKDSTNPHFKSRYADLASIWDACRAALSANGLAVVQMPEAADPGTVALTTTLMHSSGEWVSATVTARLPQDNPQGVGSALTYLRRYALAAAVGVAPDDDDGNAASTPAPNGNGHKPAQPAPATNGKHAASITVGEKVITRAQIETKWATLWAKAQALGIKAEPLPGDIDTQAFYDRAQALAHLVKDAEGKAA